MSFLKALEIGLSDLKILRLSFKENPPQPEIKHWKAFSAMLQQKLPKLEELYLTNEIPLSPGLENPGRAKDIIMFGYGFRTAFNTKDWKSLRVLHLPWDVVAGAGSMTETMHYGLTELVIDVKGYVFGLQGEKWNIVAKMADMLRMHSHTPQCRIIIFNGWAIAEEKELREGRMTKEEYHEKVKKELIEENNRGNIHYILFGIFID
jgi:hypothetical protein